MSRWSGALRVTGFALLALVAVLALRAVVAPKARPHPYYTAHASSAPDVLVIAHQGGNHLWPDNTLLAFENAVALGVDVLEMDVNMTADGEIVVIHDTSVDRTTNGSGAVSELTLAEIKALDAAYHWTPLAPDGTALDPDFHPYRDQGVTVPTLNEVFEAFPEMRMTIEIKQETPSMVEPFCATIREYGMADRVLVASFHVGASEAFRRACPEVATSGHRDDILPFWVLSQLSLHSLYSPGELVAFQVPREFYGLTVLTPGFVADANARGVFVEAWTINTEAEMRRLIEMGVDGLITDEPGLALEVLGR